MTWICNLKKNVSGYMLISTGKVLCKLSTKELKSWNFSLRCSEKSNHDVNDDGDDRRCPHGRVDGNFGLLLVHPRRNCDNVGEGEHHYSEHVVQLPTHYWNVGQVNSSAKEFNKEFNADEKEDDDHWILNPHVFIKVQEPKRHAFVRKEEDCYEPKKCLKEMNGKKEGGFTGNDDNDESHRYDEVTVFRERHSRVV